MERRPLQVESGAVGRSDTQDLSLSQTVEPTQLRGKPSHPSQPAHKVNEGGHTSFAEDLVWMFFSLGQQARRHLIHPPPPTSHPSSPKFSRRCQVRSGKSQFQSRNRRHRVVSPGKWTHRSHSDLSRSSFCCVTKTQTSKETPPAVTMGDAIKTTQRVRAEGSTPEALEASPAATGEQSAGGLDVWRGFDCWKEGEPLGLVN